MLLNSLIFLLQVFLNHFRRIGSVIQEAWVYLCLEVTPKKGVNLFLSYILDVLRLLGVPNSFNVL